MTKNKRYLKRLLLGFALLSAGCVVLARLAGTVFSAFVDTNSSLSTATKASVSTPSEVSVIRTIKENSGVALAQYATHDVFGAKVHVVQIAPDATVFVAVADDLAPLSNFTADEVGLVRLNAGFFDPQNGKTTSHITVSGQVAGDPADNERLVDNPSLQQYLPQILNRSEFRVYRCGPDAMTRYDIVFHDAPLPIDCQVEHAVGAGPQLLPVDTSDVEAFTDYENGELIRDAIGSMQPNARSAVGIDENGLVYLLMVEKNADSAGLTLAALADFGDSLGLTQLLNLDGGSSSSLQFLEDTYFGRADADNVPIQRAVKSVILVD